MNEPQYNKSHKFFEKYLNNDLGDLQNFLEKKYELITSARLRGVQELGSNDLAWMSSGSVSTVKWQEYNVFQLYHPAIYNLFKSISQTMREACEYYDINFDEQKYYVQGWFNINNKDNGKLDWHDHGDGFAPRFHGYYCVNAEPSSTYYRLFNREDQIVENINKNNRMIISEMGHPHAMGDWAWSGARVTIAYDIMPVKMLIENDLTIEQHWIPLL